MLHIKFWFLIVCSFCRSHPKNFLEPPPENQHVGIPHCRGLSFSLSFLFSPGLIQEACLTFLRVGF